VILFPPTRNAKSITCPEERSRIRKGHGPENTTRLRRFAAGPIKSNGLRSAAKRCFQRAALLSMAASLGRISRSLSRGTLSL